MHTESVSYKIQGRMEPARRTEKPNRYLMYFVHKVCQILSLNGLKVYMRPRINDNSFEAVSVLFFPVKL